MEISYRKRFHVREFLFHISAQFSKKVRAITIFTLSEMNIMTKVPIKSQHFFINMSRCLNLALTEPTTNILYPILIVLINGTNITCFIRHAQNPFFPTNSYLSVSGLEYHIQEPCSTSPLRQQIYRVLIPDYRDCHYKPCRDKECNPDQQINCSKSCSCAGRLEVSLPHHLCRHCYYEKASCALSCKRKRYYHGR